MYDRIPLKMCNYWLVVEVGNAKTDMPHPIAYRIIRSMNISGYILHGIVPETIRR